MSTTVESADGVPVDDLAVGDVVVVDREIDLPDARTFATVVDRSERGPLVAGPTIESATLARALKIECVTRYDEVVGQDAAGVYHLLDRSPHGFDVLDVIDAAGSAPVRREHLIRDGDEDGLHRWLRFVAARRGWQALPERHRAVLDGGDADGA